MKKLFLICAFSAIYFQNVMACLGMEFYSYIPRLVSKQRRYGRMQSSQQYRTYSTNPRENPHCDFSLDTKIPNLSLKPYVDPLIIQTDSQYRKWIEKIFNKIGETEDPSYKDTSDSFYNYALMGAEVPEKIRKMYYHATVSKLEGDKFSEKDLSIIFRVYRLAGFEELPYRLPLIFSA